MVKNIFKARRKMRFVFLIYRNEIRTRLLAYRNEVRKFEGMTRRQQSHRAHLAPIKHMRGSASRSDHERGSAPPPTLNGVPPRAQR